LPGIYTGGRTGVWHDAGHGIETAIENGNDAGGAGHVGNPNLPGLALNDGQARLWISGLPGIYTGGPGSDSGMTPPRWAGIADEDGRQQRRTAGSRWRGFRSAAQLTSTI